MLSNCCQIWHCIFSGELTKNALLQTVFLGNFDHLVINSYIMKNFIRDRRLIGQLLLAVPIIYTLLWSEYNYDYALQLSKVPR